MKVKFIRRLASLALRELMRDRGHDGERRAVHHRGAEAADQPGARAISGEAKEVDDVLDHGEAGADRESGDHRVELEADAVHPEEHDDHRALDRFLDPRGDEAAVDGEADRQRVEQASAHRPGEQSGDRTQAEQGQDFPEAHQLERVEPVEHREQNQDGDECEAPVCTLDQE